MDGNNERIEGGRGRVRIIMHGRSHVTMHPRIRTVLRRCTSGFTHQADIACTKRDVP